LAARLGVQTKLISDVLKDCGEPEAINNSPTTAPSKRLDAWAEGGKFKKTTTGIAIAEDIGINGMREKCTVFNTWLVSLESLVGSS